MPPCECHEMVAHTEYELNTGNELRVLPIRMPPCKCQEMVAHNEYQKLHTRNGSRVLPIRISASKCQKKKQAHIHTHKVKSFILKIRPKNSKTFENRIGGPARPPSYHPDQGSPTQ
ncbi:hypothetical protein NDU88_006040 [Pleurodeles waltl]|uniref:Uncharacterized protein n=1 Tax=Pleurodeles waltl TaxID=8319 RepID=A0AAV7TX55_PLEWA|nr:hypothetical protein NDU88_006040 [Pleurodeles waltl]